jgi:outer membrane lipoprotein carrier protein
MKRLVITVLLLALAGKVAAQEALPPEQAKPILENLQRGMSSLNSVIVEFMQERHLKLFVEPLKSEGVMLIEKPDRIRWETTKPYQSILLGDHKSVAQFEGTDGKWKKLKLGFPQMLQRVMEQMTLMHQGKLDGLTSEYTVSVVKSDDVSKIVLVPKNKEVRAMLDAVEMHMNAEFLVVREILMREAGGDFTRIVMRNERRDVKLPAGTFDQNKPLELESVKAALPHAP